MLRGAAGPHTSPEVLRLGDELASGRRRLFLSIPKVGAKWPRSEEIQSVDFEKFPNSVFDHTAPLPIGSKWRTSEIAPRLQ